MHLMLEYAPRAVVFTDGKILCDDSPANILTNPDLVEAASLKETSLFTLAVRCGISEPSQFVQRFIDYAARHTDKRFLVTRVGCGNAGHDVHEVARLFVDAIKVENISLPEDFWEILGLKMFKK